MRAVAFYLALVAALVPVVPAHAADLTAPVAPALESARQALVGEWRLDTARSDDPLKLVLADVVAGDRLGQGSPGGDPWTDAPWAGDPWTGPHGRGGVCVAVGRALEPEIVFVATRLTITNLVPEVTLLEPDGAVRRLRADGKPRRAANGVETTARWDDSRLLVETRTRGGGVLEIWSASQVPRSLHVLLRVARRSRRTVEIRRVFEGVTTGPAGLATASGRVPPKADGFLLLQASRTDVVAEAPAVAAP